MKAKQKRTVGIFTTTRAESGAFAPLIRAMDRSRTLGCKVFVGGAHLAAEYGKTIQDLQAAKTRIDDTFDYLLNEDTAESLTQSCGIGLFHLSRVFSQHAFDYTCIAGDRFELVPIALASILFRKPIIHLYGGERTEGVIDEQVRHMLTKSAHLHFTSCDEYTENVVRLGEPRSRVRTAGELVIDQMAQTPRIDKKRLFGELGLADDLKTLLLTYHPVTLDAEDDPLPQIETLFDALRGFAFQVVITAPNCEVRRERVLEYILEQVRFTPQYKFFHSLGAARYYSLIPHCHAVIGNSSSGIIEVPFFRIPSINIGDRQKGRIQHDSVLNASCTEKSIRAALHAVQDPEFAAKLKGMTFKLGDGHAAERIVKGIEAFAQVKNPLYKALTFEER